MPTVTSHNKKEFDRKEMERRGLIKIEKPFFENVGKKYKAYQNGLGAELPEHELLTKLTNKSIALVNNNPYLKVSTLPNGNYEINHIPAWGSTAKAFRGEGKDLTSLIVGAQQRLDKSNKTIEAIKNKKEENSLLGMLKKEYGDVFSQARSTQSKSEYITHEPSNTKIRISDHNLPLHYESPDIDLRLNQPVNEQFKIIKDFLSG